MAGDSGVAYLIAPSPKYSSLIRTAGKINGRATLAIK